MHVKSRYTRVQAYASYTQLPVVDVRLEAGATTDQKVQGPWRALSCDSCRPSGTTATSFDGGTDRPTDVEQLHW